MEKKQTAIEWLESRIHVLIPDDIGSQLMFKSNIKKAKTMEKEQIMEAVSFGDCRGRVTTYLSDEEYYKETYGSKGNDETKEGYICPATKVQCDDECCVNPL